MKAISVTSRCERSYHHYLTVALKRSSDRTWCSLQAELFHRLTLVLLFNAFRLPHSQALIQKRSLTAAHACCLIVTQMVDSTLFSSEKCAGLNGPRSRSPAPVPAASAGRVLHQAPAGLDSSDSSYRPLTSFRRALAAWAELPKIGFLLASLIHRTNLRLNENGRNHLLPSLCFEVRVR